MRPRGQVHLPRPVPSPVFLRVQSPCIPILFPISEMASRVSSRGVLGLHLGPGRRRAPIPPPELRPGSDRLPLHGHPPSIIECPFVADGPASRLPRTASPPIPALSTPRRDAFVGMCKQKNAKCNARVTTTVQLCAPAVLRAYQSLRGRDDGKMNKTADEKSKKARDPAGSSWVSCSFQECRQMRGMWYVVAVRVSGEKSSFKRRYVGEDEVERYGIDQQ